jgi:Translation elongation factors (GTPases)
MQCVKRSDFEGCVWVDEFGQHLIGGVDGSHLNLLVKKIKEVAKCEIKLTDPLSSYREIVSEKSQEVLSKLHLTRFQCTGQPLQEELAFLIETDMSFAQNELLRTERLTKEFNWSLRDANNLYAIDSERFGPNLLVNQTPEDHCKLVFEYRDSM